MALLKMVLCREYVRKGAGCIASFSASAFVATLPWGPTGIEGCRNVLVGVLLVAMLPLALSCAPLPGTQQKEIGRGMPSLKTPVLFVLSFLISGAAAAITTGHRSSLVEACSFMPVAFLLFLAFRAGARSETSSSFPMAATAVVVVVTSIDAIVQSTTGESLLTGLPAQTRRISASLPNPNDLAFVAVLAPIACAWLLQTPGFWRRIGSASVAIAAMVTVILSQSRSAMIGATVAMVVGLALSCRGRSFLIGLALMAMALAATYLGDIGHISRRMLRILQPNLANESRIGVWIVAVNAFLGSPVLGSGPGSFGSVYETTVDTITWPSWYRPLRVYMPWAHSIYLEALAERGLVGFATLAAWLTTVSRSVKARLGRWFPPEHGSRLRIECVGYASAVAAFMTIGMFDLTFLKDWVWVVWALLAGLAFTPGSHSSLSIARPT
jgi:O-antigen ligase